MESFLLWPGTNVYNLPMSPHIIHTPAIAADKRKLGRRHAEETASDPQATGPAAAEGREGDAKLQALLETARLSVLTQIKSEAESARELGRQRGLVEGRQAAREEVRQALSSEISRRM